MKKPNQINLFKTKIWLLLLGKGIENILGWDAGKWDLNPLGFIWDPLYSLERTKFMHPVGSDDSDFATQVQEVMDGVAGRYSNLAVSIVKKFVNDSVTPQIKMSTALATPTGYRHKKWFVSPRNVTVSIMRNNLETRGRGTES